MRRQENLPLGVPGAETPKHHISSALLLFRVSHFGFSGLASTRELANRYLGTEIPKYPILSVLSHFGIPPFGISRYVKTRGLAPRFPGSRKLRVIKTLNMLHYFGVSSIGISLIGVSRLANSWGPHLGTPGAEIPKYNHFSTLYPFGVSQVGISGLASTRETYPWVFRVPKHRNVEPSHAMPIQDSASRGFVYRNFAIQEVEDSHSSTTRMPKSRYTRSSYT
jgi:hypothetical protein